MMLRKNLLKERIRNKLQRKIKNRIDIVNFRKLRKYPRYPTTIPSLSGVGLTVDDAYYLSEELLKKTGEFVGKKVYGYTKKESDRQNLLLKNLKWLEHKTHHIHSGYKKTINLMHQFEKIPVIDTPMPELRKKIYNLIKRGK